MDEMSTPTISPKVCGGLLSKTLPEVIETDRELGHFADALETLDRLDRELKPEEKLLKALLSRLIADYDKKSSCRNCHPIRPSRSSWSNAG
jgi:hypothetical protein